jgi:hypothetical protein
MREPSPSPSPRAREASAIEYIVELIRTAIAPDGDNPITNEFDPFEGDPEFEIPKRLRGTTIASSEIVSYGNTAATALMVRSTVNFLQDIFAIKDGKSPWGSKQQNRKAIAEVARHVNRLQRSLERLPGAIRYLLYSTSNPNLMNFSARSSMEKIPKVMTRFHNFAAALKMLRDRCGELFNNPPGERVNIDYEKKLVAGCAADLLDYYRIEPTRGNYAQPSLFEQVAASLFEAATGEAGADLSHACREVLKDWKTQGYFRSDFNESEGLS